jgi:hypothetical protein
VRVSHFRKIFSILLCLEVSFHGVPRVFRWKLIARLTEQKNRKLGSLINISILSEAIRNSYHI